MVTAKRRQVLKMILDNYIKDFAKQANWKFDHMLRSDIIGTAVFNDGEDYVTMSNIIVHIESGEDFEAYEYWLDYRKKFADRYEYGEEDYFEDHPDFEDYPTFISNIKKIR